MTSSRSVGSRTARRRLCLLPLFSLALPLAVSAQDTDYLREMPPATQVVVDMRGRSDRETAARASVALDQLAGIIHALAGDRITRNQLTPDEAGKLAQYQGLSQKLLSTEDAKVDQNCNGDGCEKYSLYRCQSAYLFNPASYRELLDRYFSAAWQARYVSRLQGTMWQEAMTLPHGTTGPAKLGAAAVRECTGAPTGRRGPTASAAINPGAGGSPGGPGLLGLLLRAVGSGLGALIYYVLIPLAFVAWVVNKIRNMRRFVIRRSNREAIEAFGADQNAREHAIIDAFDNPDFTFKFIGVLRSGYKIRFTLLRSVRSFRQDDLESMRFAYLAYNREVLDDEEFHWFRFSAIYGGGITVPSEWKFLGLFARFRSKRGAVEVAKASAAAFAGANGGTDLEARALARIQQLAVEHPGDDLYRDMKRRFVEGAYWLTRGELKRSAFAPSDSRYSLTFGPLDGTGAELVFSGDGSVMTIAPPGSGKTQCNVYPNLLRWPGPAVVLDVKGEIYDNTSRWRAANVGPVIRFSPLDPGRSACYNPLSGVRQDSLSLWEDARFLANMMIVPVAKEPFWEDKAREILTAIIADVAFWNRPDDRPLSRVLSLVNRNGWEEFVERLKKNPEIQTMRDEGNNLAHMEPKTLDGALQTAKASLSAWVGERIAQVTRQSDWSPLDLRSGRNPTIYVCIKPNEIDAYLSLLRVVIAQHIRALTSAEIPPRDAAPILFVLDELPRLKHMPPVEEALEVGRGYGIKLWMFSQSLGQMRTAYPNADGMIGSCAVRTFMNPSLQDGTAKMLAEQIGFRKGEEHGGRDRISGNGQALVVEPTILAGAEYKELQIVMGVGTKPAKVRKVYAYENPELVSRMGAFQPQAAATR